MKKTMKTRTVLIALTALLAMSLLAGCNGGTNQASSSGSQAPTTSQSQPQSPTSSQAPTGSQSN